MRKWYSKVHHMSSHFPVLMKALNMTDGDVLEMGTGFFSTPLIHWMCIPKGRYVLSLETSAEFLEVVHSFRCDKHEIRLVTDWDNEPIDRPWDVVFIDHWPAERRKVDIARFAELAKLIVVHDTNGRQNRHYHFDEIWALFKYRYDYAEHFPQTTILSNTVDLSRAGTWL